MKKLIKPSGLLLFFSLIMLAVISGCSSDASDELPGTVSKFITQYFPDMGVKSYQTSASGNSVVVMSGGPTIMFDKDERWTEIDGNGSVLPEVLMYDELPPELYSYLQSTEQQNGVYELKRDKYYYKLTMLDTVLTYDIATGKVTYPGSSSTE